MKNSMLRLSCFACGADFDLSVEKLDEYDSQFCQECGRVAIDFEDDYTIFDEELFEVPVGLHHGSMD